MASIPFRTLNDLERLKETGADLVELRLDYIGSLQDFDIEFIAPYREILILTVRDPSEGGVSNHSVESKLKFLRAAVSRGYLVDVEADFAEKNSFDTTGQIVSKHFLDKDPQFDELISLVKTYSERSRIIKIALRKRSDSRNTIIRLLDEFHNLAVMETDGEGSSRILYSLLGSCLLYCHIGEKTSPGQIGCDEAAQILSILRKRLQ